jgi:hypothetical protein
VKHNISKEIAKGFGITKVAQEKDAAAKALEYLKTQGVDITKKVKMFCEN